MRDLWRTHKLPHRHVERREAAGISLTMTLYFAAGRFLDKNQDIPCSM